MSHLLGQVDNGEEIERVFTVFSELRRPRTQKLVDTSRETGMLYDFEGEGVGDDLDKLSENLSSRLQWIWEEDLQAHLEEGKRKLAQSGPKL